MDKSGSFSYHLTIRINWHEFRPENLADHLGQAMEVYAGNKCLGSISVIEVQKHWIRIRVATALIRLIRWLFQI